MKDLDLQTLVHTNGGGIGDSSTWGNLADATTIMLPAIFGRNTYSGILLTDNMREYLKIKMNPNIRNSAYA